MVPLALKVEGRRETRNAGCLQKLEKTSRTFPGAPEGAQRGRHLASGPETLTSDS